MFFTISKVVWFFAQPSTFIFLALLLGFAPILMGRAKPGRILAAAGLSLYIVLGFSPLANWLTLPLEERFERPDISQLQGQIDGIIILGGGIDTTISRARKTLTLNEGGDRVVETLSLAKRFPDVKVVISGGHAGFILPGVSDGAALGRTLKTLTPNPDRILVEGQSKNTYQNAKFTKKLLGEEAKGRWLLVTSAFHMPRAMGCFRRVGINPIPWPVDYRTGGSQDAYIFFDQASEGLRRTDLVLREWIGLLVYWMTGRTQTFLPGPE